MTGPNVEPAVEHVATYIKSRLQNEILTASIAQEIEGDGNKKKEAERKRRTPMKKQGERRKGEEGRSLTSTFNEVMIRPVCLVSKMIMNAWCMCLI